MDTVVSDALRHAGAQNFGLKVAALTEGIEFKERDAIGRLPRGDGLIEHPHFGCATTSHAIVHLVQPRVHTCAIGFKRGFGLVILRLNAR